MPNSAESRTARNPERRGIPNGGDGDRTKSALVNEAVKKFHNRHQSIVDRPVRVFVQAIRRQVRLEMPNRLFGFATCNPEPAIALFPYTTLFRSSAISAPSAG